MRGDNCKQILITRFAQHRLFPTLLSCPHTLQHLIPTDEHPEIPVLLSQSPGEPRLPGTCSWKSMRTCDKKALRGQGARGLVRPGTLVPWLASQGLIPEPRSVPNHRSVGKPALCGLPCTLVVSTNLRARLLAPNPCSSIYQQCGSECSTAWYTVVCACQL